MSLPGDIPPGDYRVEVGLYDDQGRLRVADYGNNRIQVFMDSGYYQTQWGTGGSAPGQRPTAFLRNQGYA